MIEPINDPFVLRFLILRNHYNMVQKECKKSSSMNDFPISRYLCVESRSPLCCSQFRLNSRPRVAHGPKPIGPCLQWSCICRGACSTQCKNKTITGDWIIWKHTIQSAGLHRIWVSRIVLVDPRRGNGKDPHPFVIPIWVHFHAL